MLNGVCFFGVLILALIHLYFSLVQRTILQISRSGALPVLTAINLTPGYFKLALPLTVIKWTLLIYWAYAGSAVAALSVFAFLFDQCNCTHSSQADAAADQKADRTCKSC
ncbi:MAG: hypothetical protein CTY33_05050 [Methylotenera sp.]|nr:MAG: hypothetical protein CTY33_05050 [Methylotenera sp.]